MLHFCCTLFRALLQLSAMSQHTYATSDLLPCILSYLQEKLVQFLETGPHDKNTAASAAEKMSDRSVLRWMTMLLSHFLSSVIAPSSRCNLFVPLPTSPPSANFVDAVEAPREEATERGGVSKESILEMHKEVKKMLGHVHSVVDPSDADKVVIKEQLESKLKVRKLR